MRAVLIILCLTLPVVLMYLVQQKLKTAINPRQSAKHLLAYFTLHILAVLIIVFLSGFFFYRFGIHMFT